MLSKVKKYGRDEGWLSRIERSRKLSSVELLRRSIIYLNIPTYAIAKKKEKAIAEGQKRGFRRGYKES